MRPTLQPADRVLAVRCRRPRPGDVVVLRDPRLPTRTLVKRVAAVGPRGVTVVGDAPSASTDSRTFGPVGSVWGRVVYRYGPAARAGRVSASQPEVARRVRRRSGRAACAARPPH